HAACPAERQRGAQPRPSFEELDPRLQPGLLVGAQHDTGLVVLGRENAPYPHGHVEVTGKHFAVDVAAVADVAVTGFPPEIWPWIDPHREHLTRSLPDGA